MTRLVVPERVAVCRIDAVVYVAALPDGPIHVLDGVAALIWQEALTCLREEVPTRIATATAATLGDVSESVNSFLDGLVQRGLLVARELE